MKRLLSLLSIPVLLCSCGGSPAPDPEAYFVALENAGTKVSTYEVFSVESNNLAFDAGLENQEGKTLRLTSTPISFRIASSGVGASTFDEAKVAFTMPNATSSLNTVTASGTLLESDERLSALAESASAEVSVNAYLTGGDFYLDLRPSPTLRAVVNNVLKARGETVLRDRQRFEFEQETIDKIESYLPLTQYVSDAVKELGKALRDSYAASPSAFVFGEEKDGKRISLTADGDIAKTIAMALVKEEDKSKVEKVFTYAKNQSFSFVVTFGEEGLRSSSFQVALSSFDKEAITKDYPDLTFFPSGTLRLSGSFAFSSDPAKATPSFPSALSSYPLYQKAS